MGLGALDCRRTATYTDSLPLATAAPPTTRPDYTRLISVRFYCGSYTEFLRRYYPYLSIESDIAV